MVEGLHYFWFNLPYCTGNNMNCNYKQIQFSNVFTFESALGSFSEAILFFKQLKKDFNYEN